MNLIDPHNDRDVLSTLTAKVQRRCKNRPEDGLYRGARDMITVVNTPEDDRGRWQVEVLTKAGPRFYTPAKWRSLTYQPILKDVDWHGVRHTLAHYNPDNDDEEDDDRTSQPIGDILGEYLNDPEGVHWIVIGARQQCCPNEYEYQVPIEHTPVMLRYVAQELLKNRSLDTQRLHFGLIHNNLLLVASRHVNLAQPQ